MVDDLQNYALEMWTTSHIENPIPTKEELLKLMGVTGLTEEAVKQWFDGCAKRFQALRDGIVQPESELDCCALNNENSRLIDNFQSLAPSGQALLIIRTYVPVKVRFNEQGESPSVAYSDASASSVTSIDSSSVETDSVSLATNVSNNESSSESGDNVFVETSGNFRHPDATDDQWINAIFSSPVDSHSDAFGTFADLIDTPPTLQAEMQGDDLQPPALYPEDLRYQSEEDYLN